MFDAKTGHWLFGGHDQQRSKDTTNGGDRIAVRIH